MNVLGDALQRKHVLAVEEKVKCVSYFDQLSSTLSDDLQTEWSETVKVWDEDHSKPCPYQPLIDGMCLVCYCLWAEFCRWSQ